MDLAEADPKGLVRESYQDRGDHESANAGRSSWTGRCRSPSALSVPDAVRVLIAAYAAPTAPATR